MSSGCHQINLFCSFYAKDSKDAVSAMLVVVVEMCSGCDGHGTCNYDKLTASELTTNYKMAACECNVGYTGMSLKK